MEETNVLEIGQLGDRVACDIIRAWLRRAGRHLTNFQVFLDFELLLIFLLFSFYLAAAE